MSIGLTESIYGFPTAPENDTVPQAEPVFVLSSSQLEDIIKSAIAEATAPLLERIEALERAQVDKISAIEQQQETLSENQFIQLQLMNNIKDAITKKPRPLEKDRAEILKALITTHNGKILAKDARKKMRLSKQSFTNLLKVVPDIERKPLHSDKRKRVLSLKGG
jgi:hypothetical protein